MNRRDFIKGGMKTLGVCTCAGTLASMLNSCEFYSELQPANQQITKSINLDTDIDYEASGVKKEIFEKRPGYGVKVRFSDANYGIPVIIVRKSAEEYVCFSSLCTHDNCFGDDVTVPKGYFENKPSFFKYRLIKCNCHGSLFDPWEGGKPVEGPAEKPLKQFPTEFDKNTRILKIFF